MGLMNFANKGGDLFGVKLFTLLHNEFVPLVWISAATTLLCLVLIPFLPKGAPPAGKQQSEANVA